MTEIVTVKRGFKRKTIVQAITEKMDEWLKTIDDETLRADVEQNYIVTGGCITSMLVGDTVNDYDVYFRNVDVAKSVADYYLKAYVTTAKISEIEARVKGDGVSIMVKSAGILSEGQEGEGGLDGYQYFESLPPSQAREYLRYQKKAEAEKGYTAQFITSNAISLNNDVQLILRFTGEPDEIHKNYDFVHATNWFTKHDGLTLRPEAMEATLARELKYVGSRYPICSMFRLKKFIRRGWTITAGEMLKIAWDINALDLSDRNTFYDQLCGVDAAYFHEIISALKGTENIDRTYLFELINRVFDEAD